MRNKTLSIMFVDVQGYTSLTSQQTREEQQLFTREIRSFIEKHARDKFGNIVKMMGDAFLITFDSPTDAITCGLEIQKEISRRNANILNINNFISLRIGISTGEVSVEDSGDVFGEPVNIASRIQKFAEPNEVFISETTYLAMNKIEIKAMDLGPQSFKNVLEQVRVFRILREGEDASRKIVRFSSQNRLVVVLLIGILFVSVLAVSAIALLLKKQTPVPAPAAVNATLKQDIEEFPAQPPIRKMRRFPPRQMQQGAGSYTNDSGQFLPQEGQPPKKTWNELCGDGVCDAAEQANPQLCPKDCTNQTNEQP